MLFRTRAEKRLKIFTDLRMAEKDKFSLQTILPEETFIIGELPAWINKDYSSGGATCNPGKLICSCESWIARSRQYPPRDARLLCRHLLQQVKRLNDPNLQLAILIAESAQKSPELKLARYEQFWFSYATTSQWIQVYIPAKRWLYGSFDRKNFRWAYNLVPEKGEQAEAIMADQFTLNGASPA